MKGIQFLVDDQGNKTAVLIDLKKNAKVWEDFCDLALARERQSRATRVAAVGEAAIGEKSEDSVEWMSIRSCSPDPPEKSWRLCPRSWHGVSWRGSNSLKSTLDRQAARSSRPPRICGASAEGITGFYIALMMIEESWTSSWFATVAMLAGNLLLEANPRLDVLARSRDPARNPNTRATAPITPRYDQNQRLLAWFSPSKRSVAAPRMSRPIRTATV